MPTYVSNHTQNSTELKLLKARIQLLLNQPFFGALALRLKLIPADVRTLQTNGKVIRYNPAFVDSLTAAELQGCLAHEVLHCALGHHCRMGTRDLKRWNYATDYAINPIIIKNGLALPNGALNDPQYADLSAEEIYARLRDNGSGGSPSAQSPQPSPGGSSQQQTDPQAAAGSNDSSNGAQQPSPSSPPSPSSSSSSSSSPHNSQNQGADQTTEGSDGDPGAGPWCIGEVVQATDDSDNPASEAELKRQEREWQIAAEQAVRSSKMCGHQPADVDRSLKESRESRQDWRAILRDFVAATTPSDYRWSPPNRRFVASRLYLPSVHREGVGRIVIGVDTSGSIGDEELRQFAGEITAISDEAKPESIHVVYCDAEVQDTQEFGPSEPIVLEAKGGGGTDFRPVFKWVTANEISPVCLIYLTDLWCYDYPEHPPEYPVLWVTNSRRTAPFGETVKITAD
jgi:predicted metal-dependent peptidase